MNLRASNPVPKSPSRIERTLARSLGTRGLWERRDVISVGNAQLVKVMLWPNKISLRTLESTRCQTHPLQAEPQLDQPSRTSSNDLANSGRGRSLDNIRPGFEGFTVWPVVARKRAAWDNEKGEKMGVYKCILYICIYIYI